jgi:hypothetical protein
MSRYLINIPGEEIKFVDEANYCKFVRCGFPEETVIAIAPALEIEIRKDRLAKVLTFGSMYSIPLNFEWPGMFGE